MREISRILASVLGLAERHLLGRGLAQVPAVRFNQEALTLATLAAPPGPCPWVEVLVNVFRPGDERLILRQEDVLWHRCTPRGLGGRQWIRATGNTGLDLEIPLGD